MGTAIIQVYIPSMITLKAVISYHNGVYYIQHLYAWLCSNDAINYITIRAPVTVPAPRIKGTMVAGFQNGIEHVIVFQHVATPAAISNINSRPGNIINSIVAYGYMKRHGDFYSCYLFFNGAN